MTIQNAKPVVLVGATGTGKIYGAQPVLLVDPAGVPYTGLSGVAPWATNVAYSVGQRVVTPTGAVAYCVTAHTSGAVYDSTLWNEAGASKAALDQADISRVGWVQPDPLRSSAVASTPDGGGPRFFQQFAQAKPMAKSSFFPIGVWAATVDTVSTVVKHRDTGVNLYVGLYGGSMAGTLNALAKEGTALAILQAQVDSVNWPSLFANGANPTGSSQVVGWALYDEADMIDNVGTTGLAAIDANIATLPANDGRFRYNNLGKGVGFSLPDAATGQFVNRQDVTSVDLYWMTDTGLQNQFQGGKLLFTDGGAATQAALTINQAQLGFNYGVNTKRLRKFVSASGQRPVWGFVELGAPFTGQGNTITAAQIPSATWHHIIAGATGIIYFNNSFGGTISFDILNDSNYTAIRTAVTALNARITALAPVLNAPHVDNWLTTSGGAVATSVRIIGGSYYIIAGSAQTASATVTFTLPAGVAASFATVIHENRTALTVTGGTFSDTFADQNAVHIYRLDTTSVTDPAPTLSQHFVYDGFGTSRTSTTTLGNPDLGPTWTYPTGTWGIDANGQVYTVSGHNAVALLNTTTAGAGAARSVSALIGAGVTNAGLFIQSASNGTGGYQLQFNDGSNTLKVNKYAGGTLLTIPSPVSGQKVKVTFDASGLHTVYYDGISQGTFSDTGWSGIYDGFFFLDPGTGRIAKFEITS